LRLVVVQHVPFEGPGAIAAWAESRAYSLETVQLHDDAPLPELEAFDAAVLMGGPMSVNDESRQAWLRREKRWIGQVLAAGRPLLGVCLGAQLLASVLGSRVRPAGVKEIGWLSVQLRAPRAATPLADWPDELVVLHWHGETFDLPAGAAWLAETAACPLQAFAYGPALGLQFHVEATPESVGSLVAACGDEITGGPHEQAPGAIVAAAEALARELREPLYGMLDRLFASTD
jgi:GMP synthase-like glutamine amidotransferase